MSRTGSSCFTVPKLIRQHFRFDRKLLGLLSSCAYDAVREMMQSVADDPRAVPGMIVSLQTYGDQTANWHPLPQHCLRRRFPARRFLPAFASPRLATTHAPLPS